MGHLRRPHYPKTDASKMHHLRKTANNRKEKRPCIAARPKMVRKKPSPHGPRAVNRPDFHGWGQFGAKRQYTSGTDKQVSGRREAKRERRPAGLRRVRPGGWALPLTIEERPGGARTAGNCRIMYPALLRGGLTPGRSCRESNLARSASLGRDAENNAPGQDLKQKRKLIPFIRIKSVMSKSREALSAKPPGHIRCIISSGITIKYKVSFEQFMSKDQASAREEPHTPQSPD